MEEYRILWETIKEIGFTNAVADLEVFILKRSLQEFKGNRTKAAKVLSMNRTTFCEKADKYGVFAISRNQLGPGGRHGIYAYSHGCRCDVCKKAKTNSVLRARMKEQIKDEVEKT